MWYRNKASKNTKKASSGMEHLLGWPEHINVSDSITTVCGSLTYTRVSFNKLKEYINNIALKQIKQYEERYQLEDRLNDSNSSITLRKITDSLEAIINLLRRKAQNYSQETDIQQNLLKYDCYNLMLKVKNILNKYSEKTIYLFDSFLFISDYNEWLLNRLATGTEYFYSTLLQFDRSGLKLTPQFNFAIMSGMDIKSNPQLKNHPDRQKLVEHIRTNYPFFALFEKNNIADVYKMYIESATNPQSDFIGLMSQSDLSSDEIRELFVYYIPGSGLPTTDLLHVIETMIQYRDADDYRAKDRQNNILAKCIKYMNLLSHKPMPNNQDFWVKDVVELFKKHLINPQDRKYFSSSSAYPTCSAFSILDVCLDRISTNANDYEDYKILDIIMSPSFKKFLQDRYEYGSKDNFDVNDPNIDYNEITYMPEDVKEILIRLGIAPIEDIAKELVHYPKTSNFFLKEVRENPDVEEAVKQEKIRSEEEMKQKAEEALVKTPEEQKKTTKTRFYSLFNKLIDQGSIVHSNLKDAANGKYYTYAKKIGESLHLDPDVVDQWAEVVQVYIIKNRDLETTMIKQKIKSYDNIQFVNAKFLGLYANRFSMNERADDAMPTIFLMEYMNFDSYMSNPAFRTLKIPASFVSDLTMAHEIAHCLNYLALGLKIPKEMVPSGDKARDYMVSYAEVFARVYGNFPLMRKTFYTQLRALNIETIVKEAVVKQLIENMQLDEVAFVHNEILRSDVEFQRMNRLQFPYNIEMSGKQKPKKPRPGVEYTPLGINQLRRDRAEQKIADILLEQGLNNRRQVILEILKKLNSFKQELSIIEESLAFGQVTQSKQDERKFVHDEILKLNKMLIDARMGAYDHDIDQVVNQFIMNLIYTELKTQETIVSDPNWKPPVTLYSKEETPQNIYDAGMPERMTAPELMSSSKFHSEMGKSPDMEPESPKMMEQYYPTYLSDSEDTPGYKEVFQSRLPDFLERKRLIEERSRKKTIVDENEPEFENIPLAPPQEVDDI